MTLLPKPPNGLRLAASDVVVPVQLQLARQYEVATHSRCASMWPRYRLSLVFTAWREEASVELRAASGKVLDRARRPGIPLPVFGDEAGWCFYRGRCWWTFRRRQGCTRCGGLLCICDEIEADKVEQLELLSWQASRGHR